MDLINSPAFQFLFNYNIEQVYKCYVCFNIINFIKKKGLLKGVNYAPEKFDESSTKEFFINKPTTYLIYQFPCGESKILVESTANTPGYKKFKYCFQEYNGEPLNFVFNLVFTFHQNISNDSTFCTFFIECSKDLEPWTFDYFRMLPQNDQIKAVQDVEKFLSIWFKPDIMMESIFINSNAEKLYNNIVSGSIFLNHPMYKGYTLVTHKKEGIIGSSYLFFKKDDKVSYVIKRIEENSDFLSIILQKNANGNKREIQFIIVKLEENLCMFQYYFQIKESISSGRFSLLQKSQKKILLGFKKIFEKRNK